ncbi:efflux RND transporter periplasmic adaptor subunit [Micromonospora sp. WMMD1128]|uniref:efflux RND transporter periplasmic adaptor subunit n=1 Tax=unclassified Micromonospora TaxID=2617518 RepID=UPI00248C2D17|nr:MULTISPECIES: efflux RND transporter periplasmic adaptor subunit [unclassified Micromonospora]WBB73902.1 efflux RND transporter periplasmic adaptor subunit [Micromonospora sp. WMMD1128]WFE32691.1 efflux RND transporter periplasmic adaptor subunit [Micromonospora sp. WMMD975]
MGDGQARLWRTRRGRWGAAAAGAALVLAAAGALVFTAGADEVPARPVTVVVDRGPVEIEVATTGTVQTTTTRALSFTVSGTVASVAVRPGTVVQAGQQLATLSDEDVATAAGAVDRAEQDLADARNALAEARESTSAASNCPTAAVRAVGSASGALRTVAWMSPQPTGTVTPTAPAASESATPTPSSPGAPPTSPAHPAPTRTAPTSSGTVRPEATRVPACAGGSSGGSDRILDAQRRVNQAEAAVAEAESTRSGVTVVAPIRGTVLAVAGKVGSAVGRGATFITLADTFNMQVEAKFPEADAAAIAVGQTATVGLADRAGETFPATVVQVDPAGTADGQLVRYGVVLSFTEAPKNLLIGQTAAATVRTGSVADALRVPSTAVHDVTDGHGRVRFGASGETRTVAVGLRGDQYTQVIDGLTAGDVVLRSW